MSDNAQPILDFLILPHTSLLLHASLSTLLLQLSPFSPSYTMAIGDSVISESTLFWKLMIKPTRFRGSFCEPVTRYFESEPEPCGRQEYRWMCSFTEQMINSTASIDIEFWRVRIDPTVSQQEGSSQSLQAENQLDPSFVRYRTISLHTPKKLAPIVSIFLPRGSRSDQLYRGKCISFQLRSKVRRIVLKEKGGPS